MKWFSCYRMRLIVVFVTAIVLCGGSAKADFTFGEPVNLGPTINTSVWDYPSCISADGLELYIFSNRPGTLGDADLWVMTRKTREDDWEPPVHLGPAVNSSVRECCASLSADGLELYFDAYNRPGGYGGWDIWVSTRPTRDDPWSTAVNIGPPINTSSWDGTPEISADGLELCFSSNRSGGYGAQDIWVSVRATKDDPWEEPVNLGAIVNSSGHDCAVKVTSDSLVLFFSGDTLSPYRPGGFGLSDIWMSQRTTRDNQWNEPLNLGPFVNSSSQDLCPVISQEGDTLYFGSNRPGGSGDPDIYQAPIIPIVDFNGDGNIDTDDLLIMIDNWGTDESLCDIGPMPWGDGVVDKEDLEVLMSYWGQEIDDPTLIAHWKLDETDGMIAEDSAGEHDGTVNGEPLWQPEGGMVDGAIELDGIDDYISTPFVLNPAEPFRVYAWIKDGAPGQTIISQAHCVNWLLADAVEGRLSSELVTGRGATPLISNVVITDGQWHRVGIRWDGSVKTLYVDDVEVASDTLVGTGTAEDGLYIGAGKNLEAGTFWSGLIDDVRIYNRAITP